MCSVNIFVYSCVSGEYGFMGLWLFMAVLAGWKPCYNLIMAYCESEIYCAVLNCTLPSSHTKAKYMYMSDITPCMTKDICAHTCTHIRYIWVVWFSNVLRKSATHSPVPFNLKCWRPADEGGRHHHGIELNSDWIYLRNAIRRSWLF